MGNFERLFERRKKREEREENRGPRPTKPVRANVAEA